MPCVHIDTSRLKDILTTLPVLPPHNWLITDLDCLDYCGWDGCEKWAQRELFLADEELRRDVNLRDMQMIWGIFSAIPADISKEEICRCPLPEVENPRYMSNHIVPQHPLALVELYALDGSDIFVCAHSTALLEPLYNLPYEVHDEEADNKVMNAQLCRIQDTLRKEVPDISPEIANGVQWKVWWAIFKDKDGSVSDDALYNSVMKEYRKQLLLGHNYRTTYWDPYTQE